MADPACCRTQLSCTVAQLDSECMNSMQLVSSLQHLMPLWGRLQVLHTGPLACRGQGAQELPQQVLDACPAGAVLDKFAHQQWEVSMDVGCLPASCTTIHVQ